MKRFATFKPELIKMEGEVFKSGIVELLKSKNAVTTSSVINCNAEGPGNITLTLLPQTAIETTGSATPIKPNKGSIVGSFKGEIVEWHDQQVKSDIDHWAVLNMDGIHAYMNSQENWGMYALHQDWCMGFMKRGFYRALGYYVRVQSSSHTLSINIPYLLSAVHEAIMTFWSSGAHPKYEEVVNHGYVSKLVTLYAAAALFAMQMYTSEKNGDSYPVHLTFPDRFKVYHEFIYMFDPFLETPGDPVIAYTKFESSYSIRVGKRNTYSINGMLLGSATSSQDFVEGEPTNMIYYVMLNRDAQHTKRKSFVVVNAMLHVIWYVGRRYAKMRKEHLESGTAGHNSIRITDNTGVMWRFHSSKSQWTSPTADGFLDEAFGLSVLHFYTHRILMMSEQPVPDITSQDSPFFYIEESNFRNFLANPLVFLSWDANAATAVSPAWMLYSTALN